LTTKAWVDAFQIPNAGVGMVTADGNVWLCRESEKAKVLETPVGVIVGAVWHDKRLFSLSKIGSSCALYSGLRASTKLQLDVRCAGFSRNGEYVAVADWNRWLSLIRVDNGKTLAKWRSPSPINHLAFSPDFKTLIVGDKDGACRCVAVNGLSLRWESAVGEAITTCDLSGDGARVYVGTGQSSKKGNPNPSAAVKVFSMHDGRLCNELRFAGASVFDVDVSPDSQFFSVAVGSGVYHCLVERP